jgi:hypothetical protein
MLLHIFQSSRGEKKKKRDKLRFVWLRKNYDVLRVDGFTVNSTAKDMQCFSSLHFKLSDQKTH